MAFMTFHSVGKNHPTRGVGLPPTIMITWQLQSRGFGLWQLRPMMKNCWLNRSPAEKCSSVPRQISRWSAAIDSPCTELTQVKQFPAWCTREVLRGPDHLDPFGRKYRSTWTRWRSGLISGQSYPQRCLTSASLRDPGWSGWPAAMLSRKKVRWKQVDLWLGQVMYMFLSYSYRQSFQEFLKNQGVHDMTYLANFVAI